jgi:hypothetical protein
VFLSKTNTTDLDTSSAAKAAKRAQAAGSAAASNAAKSAKNAAAAAQNAANLAQMAAQHAAVVAGKKAQVALDRAQNSNGTVQNAATMAQVAAQNASSAAQSASSAAQSAAIVVSKNVADKVFIARKWAAPRLETAADYTANTVAPKVSAALRSTAKQVSPPEPEKPGHRMLTWTMLAAGIVAGLGAAAALFRYRFRAAIAADSEMADEALIDPTGGQTAPVTPDTTRGATPNQANAADPSADSTANGRVKASGW